MVKIDVDPITGITVKKFVIRYLFAKSEGSRKKGEEYTAELYRSWESLCAQINKRCITKKSFETAIWHFKEEGIIEKNREEQTKMTFPRVYYVLTPEYFEYARTEVK